jgi:hypothetical protein
MERRSLTALCRVSYREALEQAQQAIALLTAAGLDPENGRADVSNGRADASDVKPGPAQRLIEPPTERNYGVAHDAPEPADVTGNRDNERRASSRRAGVLAVAYHSQAVQQVSQPFRFFCFKKPGNAPTPCSGNGTLFRKRASLCIRDQRE